MELRAKITDAGVIHLPIEIRESFGEHKRLHCMSSLIQGQVNSMSELGALRY